MGGFDHLHIGPVKIEYWNSVAEDLAKNGETNVYVTQSSPFDASETRAAQIAIQIDAILKETGAAKVNLVGHSQGGLDARVLASPAGLAAIALAWLMAKPGVTAPIASATSVEQLAELMHALTLELTPEEIRRLDAAGSQSSVPKTLS